MINKKLFAVLFLVNNLKWRSRLAGFKTQFRVSRGWIIKLLLFVLREEDYKGISIKVIVSVKSSG